MPGITSPHIAPELGMLLNKLATEAILENDPLFFPHNYADRGDREIAAFFAAILATGNRRAILSKLEILFKTMGPSPASFVTNFKIAKGKKLLNGFKHRFYTTNDIIGLIFALKKTLKRYESLENIFAEGLKNNDTEQKGCVDYCRLKGAIAYFVKYLKKSAEQYGFPIKSSLLPDPQGNSAFKRINLFLRWMVRKGGFDLGLWTCLGPESLIIPLDIAVGRAANCLKLTEKVTNTWRKAEEITISLLKYDPKDPVRFDFALSQYCRGEKFCAECLLRQVA